MRNKLKNWLTENVQRSEDVALPARVNRHYLPRWKAILLFDAFHYALPLALAVALAVALVRIMVR